jgi:hypothetical protein
MPGLLEPKENFDTDKRAENKDFTMSKVDKFKDTINHGVTQSDQSIHEAKDETVEQHLGENFQRQFQNVSDLSKFLMLTNTCLGGYRWHRLVVGQLSLSNRTLAKIPHIRVCEN